MSNSLLEAMATALPCIASRIAGNTDLIDDRRNGRLVDQPDAGAWAAAILEFLEDPEMAGRLGAAARRRIDEEFALPVVVRPLCRSLSTVDRGELAGVLRVAPMWHGLPGRGRVHGQDARATQIAGSWPVT